MGKKRKNFKQQPQQENETVPGVLGFLLSIF
jgi:hypothetical protein